MSLVASSHLSRLWYSTFLAANFFFFSCPRMLLTFLSLMLFLTLLYRFFNFPVRKKPSQHQPGPSASGHPGHPAPGIVTLIKNGIPNSHFGNKTLIRILPKIWNTDRVPDPGCLLFPANLKYYRIISTESAKSGCLVFYQRAEIPEIQRNYQFFQWFFKFVSV